MIRRSSKRRGFTIVELFQVFIGLLILGFVAMGMFLIMMILWNLAFPA